MAQAVPLRSEIDPQFTWNVNSIFPTDDAWEAATDRLARRLPDVEGFRGRLKEGPGVLLEYLREVDTLGAELGKIYIYAHMSHDVDTADPAAKSKHDRAGGLRARALAAVSFGEPEILGIGRETIDAWMAGNPDLAVYAHYFDSLFRRQSHVRSSDVEEVLGLVIDPFSNSSGVHRILADTDLTFVPVRSSSGEEIPIAQGNISALLNDPDREVRRIAHEHYSDAYLAFKNTMAGCIASVVKQHVFLARARRYDSPLEAALAPNHIPIEVFHSLIDSFKKHLPVWHRYWRVRRKALGYEELHQYDTQVPLVRDALDVPFERSVEWIVDGMKPLGDEYVDVLRRGVLEERWVDVYPNQNKAGGAYSTGVQGTQPFILMSYDNDVYGMSTLAHELGHSMHSYLTWRTQPPVYSDYGLFVAEVASNFNQAMVRSYLMDINQDPNFQIALIEEAMANFRRYFLIMPTLARFELEIHDMGWRGEALTADGMIELMADLFEEAYGTEVLADRQRLGITWAEFPGHLYANFYVFQYATGIAAAQALAEGILSGKPGAAEQYLQFLKSGGSRYPLDALKLAGVDVTSPEPVEKAFKAMENMVERLEQLVGTGAE